MRPNPPDPPRRQSEPVPVADLPPRASAAAAKRVSTSKLGDDELPIDDLPPRKNVTGG
jgi:hypothetical protein